MLGKYLVRRIGKKIIAGKIVETEAYIGPEDRASHAYKGKVTPRNRAEWLIGGHIYIYLVYGMYWQLNISTGPEGKPECALIRALEPVTVNQESGIMNYGKKRQNVKNHNSRFMLHNSKIASGPGKLCRWLKLDKSFYGEDVTRSKRIWLEVRGKEGRGKRKMIIARGPRVGIDYAGPVWAKKPWRFWVKDNLFVSR